MKAKALTAYPINAFTGRELVRYEWRQVPAGCEAEANRLEEAGLVELQEGESTILPADNSLVIESSNDLIEWEVVEPQPLLAADLESLTITELKDMARDADITVGRKNKAQLIDALKDD